MKENKQLKLPIFISAAVTLIGFVLTVIGYVLNKGSVVTSQNKLIIFSLILLLIGVTSLISNVISSMKKTSILSNSTQSERIMFLAQAALFAALSYIGFLVFRIDIPVGPEKTAFHFGNTFCVLAALFLGGTFGGLSGAVGLTIADFASGYVTSAPKTFFLKLCIGLIVGFVAHRIFHLSAEQNEKKIIKATVIASVCGMLFNVVADPITGYFYKTYLLGVPQDLSAALSKIATLTTSVNAVTSVVLSCLIYFPLRKALIKAGLFTRITKTVKTEK